MAQQQNEDLLGEQNQKSIELWSHFRINHQMNLKPEARL